MPDPGFVRRRPAGVLVVGTTEPEVQPWLRASGHATRAADDVDAALRALDEAPADLVVADRGRSGRDVVAVCRALRGRAPLAETWLLAITTKGRTSEAALQAGADDYLHRPFTRGELIARVRAGVRAARQRSETGLMQTLMSNVPGAIYRSAWHDGHRLELISEGIERISGYPPTNFVASTRRTLMSIVHPDDCARVEQAVRRAGDDGGAYVVEYRIVRADGEVRWVLDRGRRVPGSGGRVWLDGALFDITERRAAEQALREREVERARTQELRASRARIVTAADAARRRIERDLHDGAQQSLVLASLTLQRARSQAGGTAAEPLLDAASAQLQQGLKELRDLAHGIHPAVLSERGLAAALEALASRAPVPVDLRAPRERAAPAVEAAIYFTVAEALTNVAKYARATAASVAVEVRDRTIVAQISDDGVGGASLTAGSGLRGLADRLDALGGTLSVDSPPGAGTTVRASAPVDPGL